MKTPSFEPAMTDAAGPASGSPSAAGGLPSPAPVLGDWYLAGASVRGALHLAHDLPNQDALKVAVSGQTLALAVADGHGDHRHFRSARGSELAVEAGCSVGSVRDRELETRKDARGVVDLALSALLPGIVAHWEEAVAADVAAHPFSADERIQVASEGAVNAYGSTLMLALVSPRWAVLVQIGDGDILAVDQRGTVQVPIPWDPLLDGHHTTSLCQLGAVQSFRVAAIDQAVFPLGILLLATDGYGNAQVDDPWHGPVGRDLAQMAGKRGIEWLLGQLPEWAARCASTQGSGDDTTMGLLLNGQHFPLQPGAGQWPASNPAMDTVPVSALGILGLGPARGSSGRRRFEWRP